MSAYVSLGNVRVVTLGLTVPSYGMWTAHVQLATAAAVPPIPLLTVGGLTMRGAVYRETAFAGERRALVVGGYGGWRKRLPSQHYQLDSGVMLSTVLGDAAREVGERLGTFGDIAVGRDYTRPAGNAVDTLRRLAAVWRIDVDGVTQLNAWPSKTVRSQFNVESFDGAKGLAVIATEAYQDWLPGAIFENATVAPARKVMGMQLEIDRDGKSRVAVLTELA